MQSFENIPTVPAKRLGVALNVDTGYKGKAKDDSPPRTPRTQNPRAAAGRANIAGASRALNVRPGPRETFLDDITPVDPFANKDNHPDRGATRRDPHDLSLSPRQVTRDSLVDHMLLSLDQFSFGQVGGLGARQPTVEEEEEAKLYSTFGDEEAYHPTSNFAPRNGRAAGHGYSYSSDYDNADDSSRYPSPQLSRGRRSNSSSNFQTGLGKVNGLNDNRFGTTKGGPLGQIPPRGTHSRSGKGSKGSSANSLDLGYAQVTSNTRWAHGLAGRSSSFDSGSDRQAMNSQANIMARQTNIVSPSFGPYDYDAAPTPTVPVGPRRHNPASPTLIHHQETEMEPVPHKVERKRSTKSSKSAYKAKSSSNARFDYGLQDRSRELPPLPAFNKESSAPAPLVGYGKSKDAQPSPPLPLPLKDKPGFFRRVFGSSRSNSTSLPETSHSHGSNNSSEAADRPGSRPFLNASRSTQISPPPRDPPPPPREPHVLTKRPSSFFRRRKKSVSEPEPPVPAVPPVNVQLDRDRFVSRPQDSPVSSLRKVMDPYLHGQTRSPIDSPLVQSSLGRQMNPSPDPNDNGLRSFSPSYDPDKSATIRAVKNGQPHNTESPAHNPYLASPSPGLRKPSKNGSKDDTDASFLQDSSDNDREAKVKTSSPTPPEKDPPKWPKSPMSPTAAVARDMALVAEYERTYSKRSPATAKTDIAKPALPVESPQSLTCSKSSHSRPELSTKREDSVVLTPTRTALVSEKKENRVGLATSSSEETLGAAQPASPLEVPTSPLSPSGSVATVYKSATSLPLVQIEGEEEKEDDDKTPSRPQLLNAAEAIRSLDQTTAEVEVTKPQEADHEKAKKIYDGNEDFVSKEKAAAWMGEEGPAHTRVMIAYMELYDFANLNILVALRTLCGRLALKAETQQVDRILDAFARRWCECNPHHGFKVTDVVHTICYSILLLNTDLHLADIDQKMTRSQFVKNTMPTICRSVAEAAPNAFDAPRASVLPGKSHTFDVDSASVKVCDDNSLKPERASIEVERPSWRLSFKPPARADSGGLSSNPPTPLDYDKPIDSCGPLVKAPFHGTLRTWEVQVEIVLKDFYNSIRTERLPLFGAGSEKPQPPAPSSNSLSVFTNGMLRRTPSVLSKTPSDSQSYARGRTAETVRVGNGKWTSKNRSRPRLYPGSGFGSSRTSLDDQSSMWSPSVSSSTWSKYSLGKTQTSMSVDSVGSSWPQGDYQQSIGFANALSQAIIREETVGSNNSDRDELRVAPLLEDESLELAGAPWAKEGIVKHKHHLESLDKKAKDRNWNEVFAVIEKGYMSLFSFSTKSLGKKSRGKAAGGVVGGGNWQESAESLGSFLLRQTIASALPSPGYSKARPHVWALSLPTGAVHLFQVGTPDIVKEFVSTANYWSARLSNHPLVGGISNIEYGWSDAIVNNSLVTAINESAAAPRPSTGGARPSIHSSLRSSLDQGYGGVRSRIPGDKIYISDWTPPTQSMRASNLMEPDQLTTLIAYVAGIEEELQKHNQLRSPMLLAFTPRHPNAQKAMANWEKKSAYLLREIVKFRTYIDCLQAAEVGKQKIYAERAAAAKKAEAKDEREGLQDDDEADVTLKRRHNDS